MNKVQKAVRFADMLFRPEGVRRPDKRQVFDFLMDNTAITEKEVFQWEKESFVCFNGQTAVYGEYYPI